MKNPLFIGAVALAAALYGFTRPDGVPWGVAALPFGALGDRPLPHLFPITYYLLPALAAGCLGAVVTRYLGWRVGLASAIAWTFTPIVWNGAILGQPVILYASAGIVGLWFLNTILVDVLGKAAAVRYDERQQGQGTVSGGGAFRWRQRINHLASQTLLAAAVVFAIVSLCLHDYRLGEAASVYARGVVEEAGERVIVLNGLLDRQIEWVKGIGNGEQGIGVDFSALSLKKTDDAIALLALEDWVKREWPEDAELVHAAQQNVMDFLTVALDRHPERFYLMDGSRATLETWTTRWADFAPYLDSSDVFVPTARRLFAHEANAVANRLQETDKSAAWRLYWRILNDVNPRNIAALVNLKGMMSNGYPANTQEMAAVEDGLAEFLGVPHNRHNALAILQAAGPVRHNAELLATMEATRRWITQPNRTGEMPPEVEHMIDLSDEMIVARAEGDKEKSERLARQILVNPCWRRWPPANAVLGDVLAVRGEYAAAEAYYRMATAGGRETPDLVWSNYASVLIELGQFDEAEAILRRGIERTGGKFPPFQKTLNELRRKRIEKAGIKFRKDLS